MSRFVQKREIEQRYCGSKLYYKLREVCNSTYQGMENKHKRGTGFLHSRPKQDGTK
jgi:hypothetical protein